MPGQTSDGMLRPAGHRPARSLSGGRCRRPPTGSRPVPQSADQGAPVPMAIGRRLVASLSVRGRCDEPASYPRFRLRRPCSPQSLHVLAVDPLLRLAPLGLDPRCARLRRLWRNPQHRGSSAGQGRSRHRRPRPRSEQPSRVGAQSGRVRSARPGNRRGRFRRSGPREQPAFRSDGRRPRHQRPRLCPGRWSGGAG